MSLGTIPIAARSSIGAVFLDAAGVNAGLDTNGQPRLVVPRENERG